MKRIISTQEEKQYSGGFIFPKSEIGCMTKITREYICDICGESEVTDESIYLGVYSGMNRYGDIPKKMSVKKWGLKPSYFVACDSHSEKELHDYTQKQLEQVNG